MELSPGSQATNEDIGKHGRDYIDKAEKRKILKNLVIVSCAFMFLFTAFQSLQNLQSSLNKDDGLGLASLSVIYGSLIVSCMFMPPLLISKLGRKWTISFSMSFYVLYTMANFYSRWYTLIPASILLGFAAAPLWSAKCSYLTTTGIRYAKLTNQSEDDTVTRFFGIFFMINQCAQIWGNLISSLILKPTGNFKPDISTCGANFCPTTGRKVTSTLNMLNTTLNATFNATLNATPSPQATNVASQSTFTTLISIYLATGVVAVFLIATLLDKVSVLGSDKADICNLFIATLKQLKDRRMQLLVILTMYTGLEQGFIFGDFTQAFVTCALGVEKVGFVMICFGVTDALCSLLLGKLSQYTGRTVLIFVGALVNLSLIIVLLLWKPSKDEVAIYYVIAASWGFCDAIWHTQVDAYFGHLFPNDQAAAFSNHRLWQSLGFVLAFAVGNLICVNVKLYLLVPFLVVGVAGYAAIEILQRRSIKKSHENTAGVAFSDNKTYDVEKSNNDLDRKSSFLER